MNKSSQFIGKMRRECFSGKIILYKENFPNTNKNVGFHFSIN